MKRPPQTATCNWREADSSIESDLFVVFLRSSFGMGYPTLCCQSVAALGSLSKVYCPGKIKQNRLFLFQSIDCPEQ